MSGRMLEYATLGSLVIEQGIRNNRDLVWSFSSARELAIRGDLAFVTAYHAWVEFRLEFGVLQD